MPPSHLIGAFDAKTKLAELLRAVEQGESFTITNRGRPVAVLSPAVHEKSPGRRESVDAMLAFARARTMAAADLKALIEDGRA